MRLRPPALLLALPHLAFNVAFAGALPAAFQPEIFQAGLPGGLGFVEAAMRIALFALMFFLPIAASRIGWALYGVGSLAYFASWVALIQNEFSAWSLSLAGFTAPAWTPAIWIVGIGFIARNGHPVATRAYWPIAFVFLAAHIGHAALVWRGL